MKANSKSSRRALFSSLVSVAAVVPQKVAAYAEPTVKFLNRGFFQRLTGQCATAEPRDSGCWTYSGAQVVIDISRAPELSAKSGAIRLEGKGLPQRVMVMHSDDGHFRAWFNKCTHAGRRLDPVPGEHTVQCCSVNKSTFDVNGKVVYGPAKAPIKAFAVKQENARLTISVG